VDITVITLYSRPCRLRHIKEWRLLVQACQLCRLIIKLHSIGHCGTWWRLGWDDDFNRRVVGSTPARAAT